jgi:hypothetical protein
VFAAWRDGVGSRGRAADRARGVQDAISRNEHVPRLAKKCRASGVIRAPCAAAGIGLFGLARRRPPIAHRLPTKAAIVGPVKQRRAVVLPPSWRSNQTYLSQICPKAGFWENPPKGYAFDLVGCFVVGVAGFEPATPSSRTRCIAICLLKYR